MPEATAYEAHLVRQLRSERPDIIRAAEDELQRLRTVLATVAHFINNPAHDYDARAALAHDLQLPAPEKPHGH